MQFTSKREEKKFDAILMRLGDEMYLNPPEIKHITDIRTLFATREMLRSTVYHWNYVLRSRPVSRWIMLVAFIFGKRVILEPDHVFRVLRNKWYYFGKRA
jgi:hypothetical protein